MTQVIAEEPPGHPAGLLAGPNIAREILQGMAAAAVIAMPDPHVSRAMQPLFSSRWFRVYRNDDVAGCELGGPLKNVIAIAAGMAEGFGVGVNTRATVITRGLAELTRFGVAFGGRPDTFAGLTGLGDLMATCMSPFSRNRQVGERLAKGQTTAEIVASMNMVAEGIKTHAPNAFVIVITNPLDAMVTLMQRKLGFPKNRVVGQLGILDSSRYRSFIAKELNVSMVRSDGLPTGDHPVEQRGGPDFRASHFLDRPGL